MPYTLPALPWDYAALEPAIPERIVQLHHDRHHRAYVEAANRAAEQLAEARQRGDLDAVGAIERVHAFNLSGHTLHSLYWQNLTPAGGGRPKGSLARQIARDFGDFDAFRAQLSRTADSVTGSGWAVLAWDVVGGRLVVEQIHDHGSDSAQGALPLLVLDVWEHAYYLKYGPDRKRYVEAIWELWNWEDVEARLDAARRVDLGLRGVVEVA
ncbi:MAG: superoxide dismutase [Myxococcota bacterium]